MITKRHITTIIRLLRTPYSERVLLQRDQEDIGALDVHYPSPEKAIATLTLFDSASVPDEDVVALLQQLDENLLPGVQLDDDSLQFTVVRGRVVGTFSPAALERAD
jgi:hypothetical protein